MQRQTTTLSKRLKDYRTEVVAGAFNFIVSIVAITLSLKPSAIGVIGGSVPNVVVVAALTTSP